MNKDLKDLKKKWKKKGYEWKDKVDYTIEVENRLDGVSLTFKVTSQGVAMTAWQYLADEFEIDAKLFDLIVETRHRLDERVRIEIGKCI